MISYIIRTMSIVKYPTAVVHQNFHGVKDQHTNRGMRLEADLNDTNKYYRECDKALIYKKPTPIQVVRVDYPARNKAKIVEAYYKTPSTTDYNGIYKGRYIDFEAKDNMIVTAFPLKSIHEHQIRHLDAIVRHGGIAFVIVRFIKRSETYYVPADKMVRFVRSTERSSIPYDWFKENGILIPSSYTKPVDYLKVVDQLYF